MVWALRAVDPASGPASYYLKSASTYSVGRKGCYITIQTDKTISRLHANLITEEAEATKTDIDDTAYIPRMPLRVHDLSKFGTFVNKLPGSRPLNSVPGSEASLNDGDLVTFGTNKTSFRVEFIPFFLCISASDVPRANPTSRNALRHGAYAVESWKEGCTHVLVDEGSAVTEMVIAAVAFSKPVVQMNWWQKFSMETEVVTELLPYSSYLPTLVFQGSGSFTSIKIASPELRKNILRDFSFFLFPEEMYEHGNYLIRLLKATGGSVELISKTALSILTGTRQQLVVKPRDGTVEEGWASPAFLNNFRHLSRTSEDKLVLAVLTGYIDVTSLPLPPSPVGSADSDETREESDGPEDQDTAGTLSFKDFGATAPLPPPKTGMPPAGTSAHIPIDLDDDEPVVQVKRTSKRNRLHETCSAEPEGSTEAIDDNNVKRQKGLGIRVSGNTFSTLVPFAKEPYRESDFGRGKNEFMQEERRRKEADRIAEDLFNNEKLKSQMATKSKSRARAKK